MSDLRRFNSFASAPSLKEEGMDISPVRDPLAAYSSAVFVCDFYSPGERLTGDGRLVIDLCARLAAGLNIPTSFSTDYDVWTKLYHDKRTLYIGVNCDVSAELNPVSVSICNDFFNYSNNSDFYFQPFFAPLNSELPNKPCIYPIRTFPSRATPQNIAKAFAKKPIDFDGKPVIALMLRNADLHELISIRRTAHILHKKHQAKFLIGSGPRTDENCEEGIRQIFKDLDCVQMFSWHKLEGLENPYLWMLGAATHLVTSGTLSTTSDLMATGKPVYYTDMCPGNSYDEGLRDRLVADHAVGQFDEGMLERAPPSAAIRLSYQESWNELSRRFCADLKSLLARRNNQSLNPSAEARVTNG